MFKRIREIFDYKELVYNLVSRDLKVRYKRSVLGVLWAFIEPLTLMVLFTLVFSLLLRIQTPNYPVFVLCGIIAWNFFLTGITYSLTSINTNSNLVKKIYFPKEILPISVIAGRLLHFTLSFLLLVPFLIYFRIPVGLNLLYLPLIMVIQFMVVVGLALLFSSLNTFYDDIGFLMNFVFFGLFYVTPVFYPVDLVPERFRDLYMMNPMAIIITAYRDVILYSRPPQLDYLALCFGMGLGILLFGYAVFKRLERVFAEVL